MASALDNDVLMEILLRLLAKSLMRFKSVCKKWLSLISSNYFCHQHTLRLRHGPIPQLSLILRHWGGNIASMQFFYWNPTSIINGENVMIPYNFNTVFPDHRYKILQACNGLLLLNSGRDSYRVYNPTTKLSTDINIPTYNDKDHHIARMALAFDPSKSPYYKMVCIMCYSSSKGDDDTLWVEVYDSESRSWKLGLEPFTRPSEFRKYSSAWCETQYWNNSIVWWCSINDAYYCFDIAKNEMKAFSFPRYYNYFGYGGSYLQELDGRLYYLSLDYDWSRVPKTGPLKSITVWELGGDHDEWVLKHHHFIRDKIGKCVKLMADSDGSLQLIIYDYRHSRKMKKMRAYNFLHKRYRDHLTTHVVFSKLLNLEKL